jgi:hypothetical protein
MSDLLIQNNFYQPTPLGSTRSKLYITGNTIQLTSNSCVIDLTAPTFSGIQSIDIKSQGQFRVGWLTASDLSLPISYEVYIKEASNINLFDTANIVGITNKLFYDIFVTPDGELLKAGSTYYIGVRAVDRVGNRDNNVVILNEFSTGIIAAQAIYETFGTFSIGTDKKLYGTLWGTKNGELYKGSLLGTAAYTLYDKSGSVLLSETGLIADSNGKFTITPATSNLNVNLDHYNVKVSIYIDKNLRENYVSIIEPIPEYEIHGTFSLNPSNNLIATFWASSDEELVSNLARLGTASYVIYDSNGVSTGITESNISPDSNGLFKITPVLSTLSQDLTFYSARVTITVDSITRTSFLPILGKIPHYETRGQFSINALNQFQATLWATIDGVVKKGSGLGVASYTVYDKDGIAVSGLTQTNITADVNGLFVITPVSAILLTDLTHYSVKISIMVDNIERISYRGFTLLGS